MRRRWGILLLAAACAREPAKETAKDPAKEPAKPPAAKSAAATTEPERVRFDHILIAFKGALKSRALRSQEDARRLAHQLYDGILAGTGFAKTKERFSDDRSPKTDAALGPYVIINDGVEQAPGPIQIPRSQYSKDLADRLFTMKAGDTALVEYHPKRCPFGYHILKRIG